MRVHIPDGFGLFGGATFHAAYDADGTLLVVANGKTPRGHDAFVLRVTSDGQATAEMLNNLADVTRASLAVGPTYAAVIQAADERTLIVHPIPFRHWATQNSVTAEPPVITTPIRDGDCEDVGARELVNAVNKRLVEELQTVWARLIEMNDERAALQSRVAALETMLAGIGSTVDTHINDALFAKFADYLYGTLQSDEGVQGMVRKIVREGRGY